jgi:hypothetical protein
MSEDDVKWVTDNTGRFRYRPWYSQTYLDRRAEKILFDFLNELYGHVTTSVPTGALTKLIERDARELNLYANLNRAEQGLLGVTNFEPPKRPVVLTGATCRMPAFITRASSAARGGGGDSLVGDWIEKWQALAVCSNVRRP